ncbi:MAG: LytR/AlgR family response regulator transcription factor [Lachnospiraceae bacterium]
MLQLRHFQDGDALLLANVIYLEQHLHQINIHSVHQKSVIYGKLSDLITQLPDGCFLSPHKSYIVNLSFVKCIDRNLKCFVMVNGINIPISRRRFPAAKAALEQYRKSNLWNKQLIN